MNLRAIWQLHFLRHAAHSQANLSPKVPQLGTFTIPSFTSQHKPTVTLFEIRLQMMGLKATRLCSAARSIFYRGGLSRLAALVMRGDTIPKPDGLGCDFENDIVNESRTKPNIVRPGSRTVQTWLNRRRDPRNNTDRCVKLELSRSRKLSFRTAQELGSAPTCSCVIGAPGMC